MEFLLDPKVVFLNHGSFGACPRIVHDEYQQIQRRLETQPVRFIQRELPELLKSARQDLAEFVGANHDEIAFVPNPTFAVNALARSLRLNKGDEVLASNHEYGACLNAWRFMQEKSGFKIKHQSIELPVTSDAEMVKQFWSGVTDNTKVIFLSHITSPTALTLPVAEICRKARNRGIVSIIDGAHAPGQLDLDLGQLGADVYVATCHKWLCAPKGSAFFYVRRDVQHWVEPLVVGWGWGETDRKFRSGSDFLDHFEWLGTHDPSAYLTVPKAIQFHREHDWSTVRERCHRRAAAAVQLASEVPGVKRVHEDTFFQQMGLVELPPDTVAEDIQARLMQAHQVEVPVIRWQGRVFVRISIQAYNTENDIQRFIEALTEVVSVARN